MDSGPGAYAPSRNDDPLDLNRSHRHSNRRAALLAHAFPRVGLFGRFGMVLPAFWKAPSAAFFLAWSSVFVASCCCLFPFAIPWVMVPTISNAAAMTAMKILMRIPRAENGAPPRHGQTRTWLW